MTVGGNGHGGFNKQLFLLERFERLSFVISFSNDSVV